MGYLQTAALITRIREVIEEGKGVSRTISAGTYLGNWPQGLSEDEQKRRALEGPRTRVNVQQLARSQYSQPVTGNLIVYEVGVTVIAGRLLDRVDQLSPDDYDTVQAAGAADTDVIRQALEYPRNLLATEAGTATDLVSGMLCWVSSSFAVIGQVNQGAQRIEGTHVFTGWMIARPS